LRPIQFHFLSFAYCIQSHLNLPIIRPDSPFLFCEKERMESAFFESFLSFGGAACAFSVNVTEKKGEKREKGTRHVSTPLALASDKNKSVIPEMTDGR
jgi:hypothetical protein